ncbi:MAG: peptidylprolyl isomerase [Burkholderiales bacterium]
MNQWCTSRSGVRGGVGITRIIVVALFAWLLKATPEVAAAAPPSQEALATVGDAVITLQEYSIALRTEARRRFFHTQPPEREWQAFYREIADKLIDRQLALQEAKRRGVRADAKEIDARIRAQQEKSRHKDGAHDDKAFWAAMRRETEAEQVVQKLRTQVRGEIAISDAAVQEYYRTHLDKFTEPESARISAILLKVAPTSGQETWTAAQDEGRRLLKQLRAGADFAEYARLHSGDASSTRGGDLGYLHKGMLAPAVEEAVAKLKPGEVTEPLTVLEGVALFKLHERKTSRLNDYAHVKERARELWLKDADERAWQALMARLRAATSIKLQEKYLTPS